MFGRWKVRWQNVSSWQALLEEFLRILAQVQDDAQREKRFAEVLGQSTISSLVQRKRRGGHVAYSIFTTMTQLHFLTKAPEDEILHKISHPGSHYKKSDAAKWQFKKLKKTTFLFVFNTNAVTQLWAWADIFLFFAVSQNCATCDQPSSTVWLDHLSKA